MKKIKLYYVTYDRQQALQTSLDSLFKSDFDHYENTEITIINNHTNFKLHPAHAKRCKVLHNQTRPNWDTGNLGRNWNEALIHGFKDLQNPDSEIVVTVQDDIIFSGMWLTNLLQLHKKGYTFVNGEQGDNIVSYTPEAVRRIGLWDEHYCSTCHKEADYMIRALIYNKEKSMVNDIIHKRFINRGDALPLEAGACRHLTTHNRKPPVDGCKHASRYFYWKWSGTWKSEPTHIGWLKEWPADFVENPPKPNKPYLIDYYYFEKDIDFSDKECVGFRDEDLCMGLGGNHK